MRIRNLLLLGSILAGQATHLHGQQAPGGATCLSVYQSQFPGVAAPPESVACYTLAGAVVVSLTDSLYLVDIDAAVSPRDLQQTNSGDAATGGTVAQGEAVPTVQPMAIGGGSVAAVGSDAGANAITALTINPAIFFTTPGSREATAKWSRLTDVTVFFPVDGLDQDDDGSVDYFGVRLRVNMTGVAAGSKIMREARKALVGLLKGEEEQTAALAETFRGAPNLEACVAGLLSTTKDAGAIGRDCGAGVRVKIDEEKYRQFRRQLATVREEADAKYVGLDLRLDVGDPTLGVVPNASATRLTAGLAFGRQFVGQNPQAASAGIKGRLGMHYTDLHDLDETNFAIDGGLGFEARRAVEMQRSVILSGGFEFRFGGAEQFRSELQTDFLIFRASLAVPITDAAGLSVSVGAPLIGDDVSPSLSIKANWGLLLPKLGLP